MANKYLEKLAGMADFLGKARGMAQAAGKSISRNARSLADDAKTFVNPTNSAGRSKSRVEIAKTMARNPLTIAGGGALVGGATVAALKGNKNKE